MNTKISLKTGAIIALILGAAFFRMVPHMYNFTPMVSIGLFGAAYFSKKWQAFVIPLIAIFISDLFINNTIYAHTHNGFELFYNGFYWQYFSFALIITLGLLSLQKKSAFNIIKTTLISSVLFYLITNAACFYNNYLYPQTIEGFILCMSAGIPFLKWSLLGDLFYSSVLFGSFELLKNKVPALMHKRLDV